MRRRADPGHLGDVVAVSVYGAAGVILWVLQPQWMTNEPLAPILPITLVVSAVLGVISGRGRALLPPLVFGLLIGTISAATTNGDLGRAGEFVLPTVWGAVLAAATCAGIWLRRKIS
jgi:hypothetical protein